jgi:gamma-resorcylate decarboxylase
MGTTAGKIALEEHFAIEETLMDSADFVPEDHWAELKSRILDIRDRPTSPHGRVRY